MLTHRFSRLLRREVLSAARLRAAALSLTIWGCSQDHHRPPIEPATPGLQVGIEMSSLTGRPGDSVVVALRTGEPGPGVLGGLQGVVAFDPARLRFLGQVARPTSHVDFLNDAEAAVGRLVALSYSATALPPRTGVFVFEVLSEDYTRGLQYTHTIAATSDMRPILRADFTGVTAAADLPPAGGARHLGLPEWAGLLRLPSTIVRAQVPGQYLLDLRFGDATLDGALNVLDALYLANLAVGNTELLAGTDAPPRDAVVAGNVWPHNLPGLGAIGDLVPPGLEANGGRVLNALDVLVVSRESVGMDDPIVGELVPGRGAPDTTRIPVSGPLSGSVTWTQGNIYSLQGTVTVPAGATLTIEPGVRIEGALNGSGLVVAPGGRLVGEGTALQPITFTCVAFDGCNSALNWTGNSVANPAEDAGRLRYVRVDGFAIGMWLTRLGSGTVLDYVQVAGRSGQPISAAFAINGGAVGLKHIVLGPEIAGPAISYTGWSGKAQFIVMRPRVVAGGWLFHAILPSPTPPLIYNVTSAALPGSAAAGFPRFSAGANGILRNALFYQTGTALQIEDAATCTEMASGRLMVEHSLFLAVADPGNGDPDPVPCAGYTSPDVEAQFLQAAALSNRYLPGASQATQELVAPDEVTLWDLRPRSTSMAITGWAAPPADGFFDPSATYVGAVEPATLSRGNSPWYAGWILTHAAFAPVPAPAGVSGTVSSSLGGGLPGVTLSTLSGYVGQTDDNGLYTVAGFPGGSQTLTLSGLPANCADPGPQVVSTTAGALSTLDITVTCTPAVPQLGTLSGSVLSPQLGPLGGISVTATPPGASTTTDAVGGYLLGNLPVGPVNATLGGLPAFCADPGGQTAAITAGNTTALSFAVTCTAPPADGALLLLTYICDNVFRVRNPNYVATPVTWDVAGSGDHGSLVLPARLVGQGYSETYFGTSATGTVRLYYDGAQVQVKANGGFACNNGISGSVASPEAGPLGGVSVSNGSASAVTGSNGTYFLPTAPGTVNLALAGAPATCGAGASQQVTVPASGMVSATWSLSCPAPAGAFTVDVDVTSGTAMALGGGSARRGVGTQSLLGSDAVSITVSNVFVSTVGQFTPGKVRVWFDLALTSTLIGVALVTPTWPPPPPGQSGVFVFPYSATGLTSSGGTVVVLPNAGLITASVDWNGGTAPDQPAPPLLPGAGGDPWSWFNDPVCGGGVSGGGDCYRYETYPTIPILGTSASQRVGFDLDPSIGQFRTYLLVAADISQP